MRAPVVAGIYAVRSGVPNGVDEIAVTSPAASGPDVVNPYACRSSPSIRAVDAEPSAAARNA